MRRAWWIGGAVAIMVAGAQAAVWHVAATRMEAELHAFVAAREARGWIFTSAPFERHGWPFAVRLRVPNMRLTSPSPDIASGLEYEAEEIDLGLSLLQPRRLSVRWGGLQRLRIGAAASVPLTGDHVEMTIAIAPDTPPRQGELLAEGLRLDLPGAGAVMAGRVLLHVAHIPAATGGASTLEIGIEANDIVLPPNPADALGQKVDHLIVDVSLAGMLPRPPSTTLLDRQRLVSWRDSGGSLALRQILLDWGKLSLRGSATLALDDRLQPMGTATARITGHAEALDALVAAQLLAPRPAVAAKAILGLLSKKKEDGPPVVEVPLTLQDRTLQLGRIPLARLPEIFWP